MSDYSTDGRPSPKEETVDPKVTMTRRAFLARAAGAGAAMAGGSGIAAAARPRWWSSIVWAVFENRAFGEVAALPSHRRLAREGTLLTRYFAVTHPSGPNYRAMASGETWGRAQIVDVFHPTVASVAAAASPPVPTYVYHLAGEIARRHNPLLDLHAPVAAGRHPAFFFCYDEDDGTEDNRVFAAWWGRGVRRGYVSRRRHTHYGFCRTVTDNWGLPALGRAALEPPIDEGAA